MKILCLGPVKTAISSGPSIVTEASPWSGGSVRGTTYPSSYIITENPPAVQSVTNYRSSIECPRTQIWRLPDPFDCSVYHDCYHGTDLVSYCPAQLQYNPDKQSCDHSQNVQCKIDPKDFLIENQTQKNV